MNPMQRRHFLKTALISAGAAGSLTMPALHAARRSGLQPHLQSVLARAEGHGDERYWSLLEQCSSQACSAASRARISMDHVQIPAGYGAMSVDAMFATDDGMRSFRMASYQPDSLSPLSKPFSFEVAAVGLAGFRAEHRGADDANVAIASASLLGVARPALASGRYLLVLTSDHARVDVAAIAVAANAGDAVLAHDGSTPGFACIAFSVQRLAG